MNMFGMHSKMVFSSNGGSWVILLEVLIKKNYKLYIKIKEKTKFCIKKCNCISIIWFEPSKSIYLNKKKGYDGLNSQPCLKKISLSAMTYIDIKRIFAYYILYMYKIFEGWKYIHLI
jgi:hypothetical protein